MIPGTSLAALDETDIETLFDFVAYLVYEEEKRNEGFVVINGKRYKKVETFSERI